MRAMVFLFAVACGGGTPAPQPAPKPAAPIAPVKPAAAAVENIGPEGPTDLAIPTFAVSTDAAKVAEGQKVFDAKGCGACHKFGEKLVGPDLNGVGERRKPEWIARMILHPGVMVKRDPAAKQLFKELMVEMPNQGVSEAEIEPLISFLVSHPKP